MLDKILKLESKSVRASSQDFSVSNRVNIKTDIKKRLGPPKGYLIRYLIKICCSVIQIYICWWWKNSFSLNSIVLFQSEKDNQNLMIKQEELNYDEENFDPLCEQKFSEGQLDWHMEIDHDEKKFGYTSDVKSNFTRHKPNVHEGTIKLLQCSLCEFTCTSNNDLYQHYENQHDSTLFRCNRCDFIDVNKTKGWLI